MGNTFDKRYEQPLVVLGDSGLDSREYKDLKWADYINLMVVKILKSEHKETFPMDVDKLESVVRADKEIKSKYDEELKLIEADKDNARPYEWRKFELLLTFVKQRTPREVEGKL